VTPRSSSSRCLSCGVPATTTYQSTGASMWSRTWRLLALWRRLHCSCSGAERHELINLVLSCHARMPLHRLPACLLQQLVSAVGTQLLCLQPRLTSSHCELSASFVCMCVSTALLALAGRY
jgi:hypothetical protein